MQPDRHFSLSSFRSQQGTVAVVLLPTLRAAGLLPGSKAAAASLLTAHRWQRSFLPPQIGRRRPCTARRQRSSLLGGEGGGAPPWPGSGTLQAPAFLSKHLGGSVLRALGRLSPTHSVSIFLPHLSLYPSRSRLAMAAPFLCEGDHAMEPLLRR
ncbi:hypothetical protein BS78_K143900 [Paspalum vaginatum]|uniref:Uncharacterized protein n=1 Tax=Paspalum vaginatum TaxID=158149 RepID=A0A9W7XFA7_9POAL|nr:hypothetical protein BS78_K143900 [Paspalum vaginatum]